MKGQRHPKISIKFTEKEVQAVQEALDTLELWEKESRSPLRRAYAEMSQALSIYHGEQRSIPETDDDAGDEY